MCPQGSAYRFDKKYTNTCRYCKKEFLGKKPNMQICYERLCRSTWENEKTRLRRKKQKQELETNQ